MRLSKRVHSLHLQTKDEIIYTYQRVFKFLLQVLDPQEFDDLSFFHVNLLIDAVFKTKIVDQTKQLKSLKQFVKEAMNLSYAISAKSAEINAT